MNRAVFLDRDNTLIQSDGYLADPEQVWLAPGAAEAVARLRGAGFFVVVATNQSGVARGLVTDQQLEAVHQRMQDLLRAQGTGIDALYYCPYLDGPEAAVVAYRRDSELRKPKPGMLRQAAEELHLDLAASWMVGDAERDVAAGQAAGCRTVRIRLKPGEQTAAGLVAADLAAAVNAILGVEAAAGARPSSAAVGDAAGPAAAGVPAGGERPSAAGPGSDVVLAQILEELRQIRRESRLPEFSAATLAGAIAQAFAICALGWGLYAAIEAGPDDPGAYYSAVIRLLAAGVFQGVALTCFGLRRR